MNLTRIGFIYEIKNKSFSRINYEFSINKPEATVDEFINMAKKYFGELEQILDKHYTGKGFTKKEEGEITPNSVEYGYNYSNFGKVRSIFNIDFEASNNIKLEVIMHEGKYPAQFKVKISNRDANPKRLFTIYDIMLTLPELHISEEAQTQINTINFLRNQKFDLNDLNKYLVQSQKPHE